MGDKSIFACAHGQCGWGIEVQCAGCKQWFCYEHITDSAACPDCRKAGQL